MKKTHKTCKQCGITYEVAMFNKKSKYKYQSKCKLCFNPSGRAYSKYYYPTAEMQKVAIQNANKIYKLFYHGVPVCIKCATIIDRRGKLCASCKKKALRIKESRHRPKRDQRKKKNLTGSFVRKSILSNNDRYIYGLKPADIPQEIVELKRKQLLLKRQLKSDSR